MTMLLNDEVNAPDAINFVKSKISKSELLKQVEKAVFFRLPSETEEGEDSIVDFFKTLEAEKSKIGVKDFSIGLSTLEEVFLELSKKDSFINDLKKGEAISENDVKRIRPGYGLKPKFFKEIIGKKVLKDVERGDPVNWEVLDH